MSIEQALTQWRRALGDGKVLDAGAAQKMYGSCTTGASRRLLGALRPDRCEQVPDIVRIAGASRVPIYPISSGHNWGYGTSLPVMDGCVVLDLSGLRRIVDFDPVSGVVVVEPGVTQQMLADFLETNGHRFLVPVSGAGPTCSLVGNALERGYGITPYIDHFAAVTGMEVVLADGRVYRSALTDAGGATVDAAFKWGLGPYLDGIFTQSGMGVVVRMSIALARTPQAVKAFLFSVRRTEDLRELVEKVRTVVATYPGVVGAINLMNAHRVLAMAVRYPEAGRGTDGLLTDEALRELCKAHQVMDWTVFGTMYGSRGVVDAAQREIRRTLAPLAKRLIFLSPGGAQKLAKMGRALAKLKRAKLWTRLDMLERSMQLVAGRPNETALPLCYWLNGRQDVVERPLNPARDGCGLAWYAPLVPMQGEQVVNYVRMVDSVMRAHQFEPLITLTSLSDRCFDSTVPLLFDLNDTKAYERKEACMKDLLESGRRQGWLPYRVGIQTMQWLPSDQSTYWQLVRSIKQAVDPNGIIAPGRYT